MDKAIVNLAQQLELRLKQIDPLADRATCEWVHGFLIAVIERLENWIPALALKPRSSSESDWAELERLAKEVQAKLNDLDDLDSLERIERELEGPEPGDPAGVPSKRKPGPKSSSRGVALPLPDASE
jgi:hypothetical protein